MQWGARSTRRFVSGAALLAAAILFAFGLDSASAATPCHSVEVGSTDIRVAVVDASCELGREIGLLPRPVRNSRDRFDGKTGDGSVYYDVDGFRCLTGLGGSQMYCRHHDKSVYASSRPEDHPASFDNPAPSGSSCADVHTHLITGREVETSPGFGCSGASKVMRKYFRLVVDTAQTQGGCAQKRFSSGCDVGDYRCHTTYSAATRELHGTCRGAKGTVRFGEIDRAPNA
jgi:hypothetical protein